MSFMVVNIPRMTWDIWDERKTMIQLPPTLKYTITH